MSSADRLVVTEADRPCAHENFAANVDVNRLTDTAGKEVVAYAANITVRCVDCDEPFRWIGNQAGACGDRPMVSVDETELRAPLRPASSDPDFGLGITGFSIWRSA